MASALEGLRVLEVADGIAGQYLGQLLADQGADVLKIEPPGGSQWRGRPQFHAWNRGKGSATADIETDAGRAAVHELASRADVLITDQTPAKSGRLSLRYEDLASRNVRLVHAWLPPLGAEGPLADLPADDALASAVGGNFGGQASASGDPVFITIPLASYAAAMLAASAVMAALLAVERDGAGQQVTVSLLAGALTVHTSAHVSTSGARSPLAMSALGRKPQGGLPTYRLYRASDDWLFLPCGNNTFYNKLLAALDLTHLLADERLVDGPWGIVDTDAREEMIAIIAPIIASQTREHWLRFFDERDIPAAPVLSRESYIRDPQVVHNHLRLELDDPNLGRVAMAGVPVAFLGTPGGVRAPAPEPGPVADEQVPSWERRAADAVAGSSEARPPLDGVLVVDLTSYIAGSLCPMILADYGADVVKVESPEGDPFRAFGLGFMGWNRGKRSIALDLRQDAAREVVYDLVRRADVVVENYRAGVSGRLGVDYESLRTVNPDIIYCSIPGWGESGPNAGRPVFDPVFQARSGAQKAQGGDGDPVFLNVAITDYSGAHLAAYAVTAGLHARERTGKGQKVSVTLAGATMAIQSGEFIFPAEGGEFGHAVKGGHDFPGPSAAYRCYPAADGWLFIACTTEEHWSGLAKAVGRPELAYAGSWPAASETDPQGGIAREVISMLAEDTVDSWLQRLAAHAVPAAPITRLPDVLDHPQVMANDFEAHHEHPRWGRVRQTGVLPKFSRTPGVAQRAAPERGQHTNEVLRELGYDEERIAALRNARAVQ